MSRATTALGALLALHFAAAAAQAQSGGGADLRWSTVDGPSARLAGGPATLYGTVGQPDTGVASADALQLRAGFWFATGGSSQTPGPSGSPTVSPTRTRTPTGGANSTPTATGSQPTGAATPTRTASPDTTTGPSGSVTPSPTPTPIPPLAGDANCDGRRSAADLTALLTAIADGNPMCGADANGDASVDDADVEALIALIF